MFIGFMWCDDPDEIIGLVFLKRSRVEFVIDKIPQHFLFPISASIINHNSKIGKICFLYHETVQALSDIWLVVKCPTAYSYNGIITIVLHLVDTIIIY